MPAPTGLIQQLDQHLHRRRLLKPGIRLLVACSGGADSIALLRLLQAINQSRHWRWNIIVGHVNHQLRGRESQRDEAFVRNLARTLKLPFISGNLRLKLLKSSRMVSEATAREGRYAALFSMARANRCHAIVLAHHADDQAETILMRLLRGAGVTGLAGINECETRGTIQLVRPLLPWPGSVLRQWLTEIGQSWREDLSNHDKHYLRNRIRHELLPALETYQPRIRELLSRNARHDRASADFLQEHARQLLRSARCRKGKSVVSVDAHIIANAHRAPAALALRIAIIAGGGDDDAMNTSTLLDLLEKMRAQRLRGKIQFSGDVSVMIRKGRLMIRREHPRSRIGRVKS